MDLSRVEYVRMGTTVATNALLERKGERHALLTVSDSLDRHVQGRKLPASEEQELLTPSHSQY